MPMIAGVDEVGRGPLAGPVVAAAVILDNPAVLHALKDSKKMTEKARNLNYDLIMKHGVCSIGQASVKEIERLNILQASLLAMKRAVEGLSTRPELLWVDGIHAPDTDIETQCFVKGDDRFPIISAASILAKVYRDRLMVELAQNYPGYGLEKHKGYPTKDHLAFIRLNGVTPIHRRTFRPIRLILDEATKDQSAT